MKRLLTAAALAATRSPPRRSPPSPRAAPGGAFLRRRLDRHHRHHGADRHGPAALGYETDVSILSVPVTYAGLSKGDIDVFLGNWMPTMEADIAPYRDDGTVEVVRPNLRGEIHARGQSNSLADAGLKDFADIAKFGDQLDGTIYGIEPGNDGNRLILDMIAKDAFGLGKFELKESSEQAMLAQAKRAEQSGKGIVFLGWEPHPMNTNIR